MPLPPYIKEELQDSERYQTVYSRELGSAAAPTAGLHFTRDLLDRISAKGVRECFVTLHVGLGTFRPVKEDEIEDHDMHSEFCIIPDETARIINETRRQGGRVVCVGTTSCRTLESFANEDLRKTKEVIAYDDVIDDMFSQVKKELADGILNGEATQEQIMDILMIAKYYERIGDHATNIAEWVEFSITGVHKGELLG